MRVLFVSSGNKKGGISPIVYNQGESLKRQGVEIDYYTVNNKGLIGYLKKIIPLARIIQKGKYDIIHAHYSLCGFLVSIATPFNSNIIVSLMGTFRKGSLKYFFVRLLANYKWKGVITKSNRMREQIGLMNAPIIPNGVQIEKFISSESRVDIRHNLGFQDNKKYIIFVSNPARVEKNYSLCSNSVERLNRVDVILLPVFNRTFDEVVRYMLAADVLILSSKSEGSPNVIKEAMAANCPIVTTNVGDVSYLLNGLEGTYIMNSFDANEGAELLQKALEFKGRILGRERLMELQLSDTEVAKKIIDIYNSVN